MVSPSCPSPISWRPFYLTLIIFLQMISDNRGADAKRYGDACVTDSECRETLFCNKEKRICDCPNFRSKKLVQFFDEETRSCLTTVGKACTFKESTVLVNFKCVPNAKCEWQEMGPRNLGICECIEGFNEDYRHLCVPRPNDEDNSENSGHSSSMEERYPIGSKVMKDFKAMAKPQIDDGNKNIIVDQEVLDRYSAGSRVYLNLANRSALFAFSIIGFTISLILI